MARRRNDGELFDFAGEQEFQMLDNELVEGRNFKGGITFVANRARDRRVKASFNEAGLIIPKVSEKKSHKQLI